MKKTLGLLSILVASSFASFAQKHKAVITTTQGVIEVVLFDDTPLHTNNFVKLANENFYDSLMFHRIIKDFMIQGGDPNSKNAQTGARLGSGSHGERIPAEFNPKHIHKKGALAAARDMNAAKASSGCQFYLVVGKVYTPEELAMFEQRMNKTFTEEQKQMYTTVGGVPHLDGEYTVYGEIVSGLEVIDKIVAKEKDAADRPIEDQRILDVKILTLNKNNKYK